MLLVLQQLLLWESELLFLSLVENCYLNGLCFMAALNLTKARLKKFMSFLELRKPDCLKIIVNSAIKKHYSKEFSWCFILFNVILKLSLKMLCKCLHKDSIFSLLICCLSRSSPTKYFCCFTQNYYYYYYFYYLGLIYLLMRRNTK